MPALYCVAADGGGYGVVIADGLRRAALVTTEQAIGQAEAASSRVMVRTFLYRDEVMDEAAAESRRAEISAFLARDDIRGRFIAMGVTPQEAERRVAGMSDAEIMQVSEQIEDLPAGQAPTSSIVLVLLLLIILIILV